MQHSHYLPPLTMHSWIQVPSEIKQLKADVEKLASKFPTIGFEKGNMKYQD